MNPDDLAKILDELGRRLGPAGSHVFELAVRQVYIDSTLGLIFGIIFVVAVIPVIRFARRYRIQDEEKAKTVQFHTTDWEIAYVFCGMLVAVFGGIGLWMIGSNISQLLNAEYTAIRDLLQAIR